MNTDGHNGKDFIQPAVGLFFFVNIDPADVAKQMAADFAMFPCAGVFVAINDHMRAEGSKAGD